MADQNLPVPAEEGKAPASVRLMTLMQDALFFVQDKAETLQDRLQDKIDERQAVLPAAEEEHEELPPPTLRDEWLAAYAVWERCWDATRAADDAFWKIACRLELQHRYGERNDPAEYAAVHAMNRAFYSLRHQGISVMSSMKIAEALVKP